MKLNQFEVGLDQPLFLIAGPCVIESEGLILDTAGTLKEMTSALGIPFIFKASFDKANRSSVKSFRGPGLAEGLRILGEVRRQLDLPVLTDVHEDTPLDEVGEVADVLQTPAFLCRQTNFIVNVDGASSEDVRQLIDKIRATVEEKFGRRLEAIVTLQVHAHLPGLADVEVVGRVSLLDERDPGLALHAPQVRHDLVVHPGRGHHEGELALH